MSESLIVSLIVKSLIAPVFSTILSAAKSPNQSKIQKDVREKFNILMNGVNQTLNTRPLEPDANDDLQRALWLAYYRAGEQWVDRLKNGYPKHEFRKSEPEELHRFIKRAKGYLSTFNKTAFWRREKITDRVDNTLMTALVSVVPEEGISEAELKNVTKQLAEVFEARLHKEEGLKLPDVACSYLYSKDDLGITVFGHNVLLFFAESIKSGRYPEASQAFNHYVANSISGFIKGIESELGCIDENMTLIADSLIDLKNSRDQVAVVNCRMRGQLDELGQLLEGIDQRLRVKGSLQLSRRPIVNGEQQPFGKMIFSQRHTAFVGRDAEMAQLEEFVSLKTGRQFQWWQIAGGGGNGKSRLALQLVDQLGAKWDAGFIKADELTRFQWNVDEFAKPTLCVIDYATSSGKAVQVVEVLKALTERASNSHPNSLIRPVRVLLIDRVGYDLRNSINDNERGIMMYWLRIATQSETTRIALKNTAFADQPLVLKDLDELAMLSICR